MEIVTIGGYEITITDRFDGNAKDPNNWIDTVFCRLQQHHSTTIIEVTEKDLVGQLPYKADGIICKKELLSAGVYTADCGSIVLLGKNYYCIVHAGRMGLYKGIIHQAVKKLCSHGEEVIDINVYIGPCAHQEQFEFGPECKELFPSEFIQEIDGNYTVDLVGLSVSQLSYHGIPVENIQSHPDCTIKNNDKYFSARCGDKERNFLGVTWRRES